MLHGDWTIDSLIWTLQDIKNKTGCPGDTPVYIKDPDEVLYDIAEIKEPGSHSPCVWLGWDPENQKDDDV